MGATRPPSAPGEQRGECRSGSGGCGDSRVPRGNVCGARRGSGCQAGWTEHRAQPGDTRAQAGPGGQGRGEATGARKSPPGLCFCLDPSPWTASWGPIAKRPHCHREPWPALGLTPPARRGISPYHRHDLREPQLRYCATEKRHEDGGEGRRTAWWRRARSEYDRPGANRPGHPDPAA